MRQHKHEKDAEFWKRQIDEAIDYYDKAGNRTHVLQFLCSDSDLSFAPEIDGRRHYRGRILLACAKPKQPKLRDVQSDIEQQ